jgi:hypothetical protein
MPARDEHIAQANHNQSFVDSFDPNTYSDWSATVLFYVALHYIDAFLSLKGQHPPKHEVRDDWVRKVPELRPIVADYFRLKNFSINARYVPPTRFSAGQLNDLRTKHLAGIRAQLKKFIPV